MTGDQFLKKYVAFTVEQRITFLARLGASLTVNARGTYLAGTNDVAEPVRLREFNEFLHRVSSQLMNTLAGNQERYPDAVFADIIWDFADAVDVRDSLMITLKGVTAGSTLRRTSVA